MINKRDKIIKLALNQAGIIAITDAEGRYIFVNKQWEAETGITNEIAIGKYADELIEGSSAVLAMRTKHTVEGEMFLRTKDGRELPAIMTYVPIFDDKNHSEIVGCFISSAFTDLQGAINFSERLDSVLQEFDYLKGDLRQQSGAKYGVESIIGKSRGIIEVKEQIYMAGATSATCLIEGETGTGKELVAHAVHTASLRNIFPFVKVNCSAIPENLLESEFFGYEEGSFTGSRIGGHIGKFEKAHLGSIFLDEINAMNLAMQPKLLRVLQEKEIERIGSSTSLDIDVRVISASNIPLKMLVDKGWFRSDLFYRLNIITISIPPLRERKDDIPILLEYYIKKYNKETFRNVKDVAGEAMDHLMDYDWPGNVRELQNVIERAMNSTWNTMLELKHFNFGGRGKQGHFDSDTYTNVKRRNLASTSIEEPVTLSEQKAISEKAAILKALDASGNNKSKAAKLLNISRTMLYKKLDKYDLI